MEYTGNELTQMIYSNLNTVHAVESDVLMDPTPPMEKKDTLVLNFERN